MTGNYRFSSTFPATYPSVPTAFSFIFGGAGELSANAKSDTFCWLSNVALEKCVKTIAIGLPTAAGEGGFYDYKHMAPAEAISTSNVRLSAEFEGILAKSTINMVLVSLEFLRRRGLEDFIR